MVLARTVGVGGGCAAVDGRAAGVGAPRVRCRGDDENRCDAQADGQMHGEKKERRPSEMYADFYGRVVNRRDRLCRKF